MQLQSPWKSLKSPWISISKYSGNPDEFQRVSAEMITPEDSDSLHEVSNTTPKSRWKKYRMEFRPVKAEISMEQVD